MIGALSAKSDRAFRVSVAAGTLTSRERNDYQSDCRGWEFISQFGYRGISLDPHP